ESVKKGERFSLVSGTWGARPPLVIDWEDVHERVKPLARGVVEEAAISPDGEKVAYRDGTNYDLWVATSNGNSTQRITSGGLYPRQIQWMRRGGSILYFLDGNGKMRLCNTGNAGSGSTDKDGKPNPDRMAEIPFKVKMTIKTDELYREMFDQAWRHLRENFYDEKFHGRDWDDVRRRYRPLVDHVAMKEDLYALLYLMMGELNASHLGVNGFVGNPEEDTAELGLFFDETHKGRGLKVSEILKR